MRLYKKIVDPYTFLIIDTTVPSNNVLLFRCNLLERAL